MSGYDQFAEAKAERPVFNAELYEKTDAIATSLSKLFEDCRKPFACSGTIPLKGVMKDLVLFHRNNGDIAGYAPLRASTLLTSQCSRSPGESQGGEHLEDRDPLQVWT